MSGMPFKTMFLTSVLSLSQALFAQSPSAPPNPEVPGARQREVPIPEPPAAPKSPIEFFRELLAMELADRHTALADRSPENRKLILAKVRQYESLNPDQRE